MSHPIAKTPIRAHLRTCTKALCAVGALSCACACKLSDRVEKWRARQEPVEKIDVSQAERDYRRSPPRKKRAKVIKHGWDIPVAKAMPHIEQEIIDSPFDGVVFSGDAASRAFRGREITLKEMEKSLAPLGELSSNNGLSNYMILYVDSIAGGFNGPNVDVMVRNIGRMAKVAGKLNIEGIAFDNEVYRGDPWTMPHACPGLDRKACGGAAFRAGKRVMEAMTKHWKDLHFLAFFGPWLHDRRSYAWINQYAPQNDWSDPKDVSGDFLAGVFAACAKSDATFIDGGELYGLRTRDDFRKTALWMREVMVEESPFFPRDLREKYSKQMKVGFGIYDDRNHLFSKLPRMNPKRWGDTIHAAVREADLVWIYTERHDWWKNDHNNWPDRSKKGCEGPVTRSWYESAQRALRPLRR